MTNDPLKPFQVFYDEFAKLNQAAPDPWAVVWGDRLHDLIRPFTYRLLYIPFSIVRAFIGAVVDAWEDAA